MSKTASFIDNEDGWYSCYPCWINHERDIPAVVRVDAPLGDIGYHFQHTFMCCNHAELEEGIEVIKDERTR